MLNASPMLPIAEDLGTVPLAVRRTLMELGICGTKVMRWERHWDQDGAFIPIQNYPELSMTCVSTHDSETLQIWWKERKDEAEKYAQFKGWEYTPELLNPQRKHILWDSHHTTSLFHINLLQEYFAIFPELVWSDPQDERINIPGKILPTNWTYRFRPSVEEFTTHADLESAMKGILFSSDPKNL
jgi:4-alpha-glucanotransferase